ncbi:iron ABC transporter permease [Kordiimonas sp. SCSIO 12610]|uniref:FecCD family ABC transporter permease n=1 Tax=Kordiimonas sp. SCSIO 12610 TaxID=2829597 RepID=UPI00210DD5D1|nr:iron ABC transporter permease [Kordiimonas sp. SCSIO 12610]UTW55668.1 iron ABC transporter permease [Kordiimonas sp. SCSIO 12610]
MSNEAATYKDCNLQIGERGRLQLRSMTMADLRKHRPLIFILAAVLIMVAFSSMLLGAFHIPASSVIAILVDTVLPGNILADFYADHERSILVSIRLPRIFAAIFVGGALGISGATLQSLFRNPLAEPGLIGVSSGAALAAISVIVLFSGQLLVFGENKTAYLLPVAAFIGGLVATIIVYLISGRIRGDKAATMLLIGVALNAIAVAGIGVLQFLSDDTQLRLLTFWMMGGLGSIGWESLLPVGLLVGLGAIGLVALAVPLNAYLLGANEARHLGINVELMTRKAVLLSALIVGAAVSIAGIISFIGLIVPHLVRQISGPDNRTVITGSALMGAIVLLLADLIARNIIAPSELPVGLVTSAVGGPFFLWQLIKKKSQA